MRTFFHNAMLTLLSLLWLLPFAWLLLSSFGADEGPNIRSFWPDDFTLRHYRELLAASGSAAKDKSARLKK